jgi:uncharacterized protein
MHLFVAGSAGRTGSKIVEYALEAGHEVTALCQHTLLDIEHAGLEKIQGDVLDPSTWSNYIFPGTVVVSALSRKGKEAGFLIDAAKLLAKAARESGASRIILIGGGGSLKLPDGSLYREQRHFPEVFREVSAAHLRASHVVEESGVSWTVFCAPEIKQGVRTKNYRIQATYRIPDTSYISFQDLADAVVDCINFDKFHHQRVAITY